MEHEKPEDMVPVPDDLIAEQASPNNPNSEQEIGYKKTEINQQEMPVPSHMSLEQWLSMMGWQSNPFIFNITPDLLVGYRKQIERVLTALKEKHKIIMIVGPTGSGKTTMLRWLADNSGYASIFVAKPPRRAEEFVDIFNQKFGNRPPKSWFIPNIKNLYEIPSYINKKNQNTLLLFDEVHEADFDVLEWLRVLSDQLENVSIIVAGLPVFVEKLKDLETFKKRIAVRVDLLSLTKEETEELIRKRIASAGGSSLEPFDRNLVAKIYEKTGGFPREIIRICNELVNRAMEKGTKYLDESMLKEEKEEATLGILDSLTPMQKEIIELLARKALDPGEIADHLNLKKYKSRQHAVRSVNNILKMLSESNLVVREKAGRAYVYKLMPAVKTMIIKA